ncbi:hypothetical protein M231_01584 [Tremella mesenterica]|uniref:FAS1 domain-containing protein n=1 Tax=Tremella mesenterica TaxID=5217 RepID=A0A4Q1BT04_TREME|nr:hypothetical protein M231_01584 [Tremella mesenterica]
MQIRFLLLPLLSFFLPTQAQETLECDDDVPLATYLSALLDSLFSAGLTTFEELIVTLSSTDSGYELLSTWPNSAITLLVPTDSAFSSAGYIPPFTDKTEWELTNLIALHTLQGNWGYGSLPNSPLNGIASSLLSLTSESNSTRSNGDGSGGGPYQVVIMNQGQNGEVVVRSILNNATSWDGTVDVENEGGNGLTVLPIDTVIPPPLSLSAALTQLGLNKFAQALNASSIGGPQSLETITSNGFTIFAPVDSAFGDGKISDTDLQNLYTTDYSLYSPFWYSSGTFSSLSMKSGQNLKVAYNWTGSYVEFDSGDGATILRSDIPITNGVLHVIDHLLLTPAGTSSTPSSSSASATPSGVVDVQNHPAPSTSSSAASNGSNSDGSNNSGATKIIPFTGLLGIFILCQMVLMSAL